MQPQCPLATWVVRGNAAQRERQNRERRAAEQQRIAVGLDLPWPQPHGRSVGRPSHTTKWQDLLYHCIREGRLLPEGTTKSPPGWWRPGMGLERDEDEASAVAGLEALDSARDTPTPDGGPAVLAEGPSSKRRKKIHVDHEVQQWFLDFVDIMKERKKWTYKECFEEAQRLVPEHLAEVHYATPFRWKRGPKPENHAGRPPILSAAEVTMLTEVAATVCQYIPVGVETLGAIFAVALREQGHTWHPSASFMKDFLRTMGLSYKRPGGPLAAHMGADERVDSQANLREKLSYTMKQHNIDPSRVYNLDETSLRLLPTHSYGWSVRGQKAIQYGDQKSAITATIAMPMEPGPVFGQLIFQGKTTKVEPALEEEPERVLLDHSQSHWQTTDTLFRFVSWLDGRINAATPGQPWCLMLDCASVHTSCEYRAKMKDALPHVKQVYVPGKTTSFNQPLDISVMKGFKTAVSKQCSGHFAAAILKGLQEGHAFDFDISRPALKHSVVGWVTSALDDVQSRKRFFRTGWGHLRAESPEQFAEICALAALHHTEGTLFRKTRHGIVPEQPPAEGEVAPAPADPVMDPEADDNVVEEEGLFVMEPTEEPAVEAVAAVDPMPIDAGETPAAEPPAAACAETKKTLSVLERCIALRIVYGRGPSDIQS